jgi:UDP-N-acetylglucosamine/UDP-N-acetylgalactosamine 4-epimerase
MTVLTDILSNKRSQWLVSGAAGFIGSNLSIALVRAGQNVIGLDNFSTGHLHNIADIEKATEGANAGTFRLIRGDIRDEATCLNACEGIDYVLHQAALGSVPRSIELPIPSHQSNVDGFIHMLNAAVKQKIKRFVYASSSSVYGDSPSLPKVEEKTGAVLSPYAATKAINELYAAVFQRTYGLECTGLRYFNVFGPRQDPNGPYAAVIPKWTSGFIAGSPIVINGDGSTSRDFCFIENVVQANILSAITAHPGIQARVFNVAFGDQTTLLTLAQSLRAAIAKSMNVDIAELRSEIQHKDFRKGDVLHSLADISSIKNILGYNPQFSLDQGLALAMPWYLSHQDRL